MQEYILLINSENAIVLKKGRVHNTRFGKIDLRNVEIGEIIETKKSRFVVAEPTISDLLKKCRRSAQIVMPKDACQIVGITGLSTGWRCLDAGTGSGFLSIFLANIVGKKGKVYTYEKRKDFYEIAKRNIEICGLKNIVIKNEDVKNFRERNLDLITFDFKDSHTMIKKAKGRLKKGGWLVIYSPHIEEQIVAIEEMRKNDMHVYATVENIQRKWKSIHGYTHPEPSGIIHTGFMTFSRRTF